MGERLVINAKGDERIIYPQETTQFPEKKIPVVDEESILRHLSEARKLYKEMAVGQREATVNLETQHPDLPAFVWLWCDSHLGSVHTDYEAFLKDYNAVMETPNFFAISNGDLIDGFMVNCGAAPGTYEDPINPEQQALLIQRLYKKLDESGKLIVSSWGNHSNFITTSGYSFEGTWLRDLKAPILNCGGLVKIRYGEQEYKLAITHYFWSRSHLNLTLAAKRFMEHEYPEADISFTAHSHLKSIEKFRKGGRDLVAISGGSYKPDDVFVPTHGGGYRNLAVGGVVLALYPHEKNVIPLWNIEEGLRFFEAEKGIEEIRKGGGNAPKR